MASIGNKNKLASANSSVPAPVRKIAQAIPDTINKAGGQAFAQTPQYKLAFMLLTSFFEDQFYRTQAQTLKELTTAIDAVDPVFAAKAAVYARTEYGMRSITHATAAHIAKKVKGQEWTKDFYDNVVYRVDDAAEILAAYLAMYGKPIPNSLKKGLAMSMSKFDTYQLAKYKGQSDSVKLVDLFNLVRPKPNAANAEAFKALIEGNLASEDTWEARLSEAGQKGKTADEKAKLKTQAWKDLLSSKKLGYFALLRNLRNIIQTGDEEAVNAACDMLASPVLIKKSLVLPFRFLSAEKELVGLPESGTRKVLKALNQAVEIALNNVPVFEGTTLVALDVSGSMASFPWNYKGKSKNTPAEIGALFAAVLAKSNDADVMLFDDRATYLNVGLSDSLGTITRGLREKFRGGGTDFKTIFDKADKKYDRIIILSDMQAWVGYNAPLASYRNYCATKKAAPKIYCFDLCGYGSLQFPEEHIFQLAGFSEKTLTLMGLLEKDPQALIKQINSIEF